MPKKISRLAWLILTLVVWLLLYFRLSTRNQPTVNNLPPAIQTKQTSQDASSSPTLLNSNLADPVANWQSRVNKKPFGIYVTPQNSPVQPERFTGYHTGIDIEYEETAADIPVFALTDGVIRQTGCVNGYGGVLVMAFHWQEQDYTALYGHLRLGSLPAIGTRIQRGQQIGLLGTNHSQETDGERRHLHLAIHKGSTVELKGYVDNQTLLANWVDPLTFLIK